MKEFTNGEANIHVAESRSQVTPNEGIKVVDQTTLVTREQCRSSTEAYDMEGGRDVNRSRKTDMLPCTGEGN